MAFMKHGAAMPAKLVDMGAFVSKGIASGDRVHHRGLTGTVLSIEGSEATLLLDGNSTPIPVPLSSLARA